MRRLLCMMVAAGVLTPAAGSARAELVVNGDFETGDFTGWSTQDAAAGSFYMVSEFLGHNSDHSALFGAFSGDHDEIFQTLPTSAGEHYLLSFWVHNLGVGEDSLVVGWQGLEIFNQTPVGTELEQWVEVTVPLSATMDGSELRFGAYDRPSGILVDDISVTLVPEPGTLSLVGVGFLALARRRRT